MSEKVANIETVIMPLDVLIPADYNPRVDLSPQDKEYQDIRDSIQKYGYGEPIIVNKANNRVVSGHQRLKVLKQMGYTHAAVVLMSYDEPTERGANFAYNKAQGLWDFGKVAKGLKELEKLNYNLDLTFFDKEERESLYKRYLSDSLEKTAGDRSRTGKRYLKVDWNAFKIWHACISGDFRAFPQHNYLLSFTVWNGANLEAHQKVAMRDTMAFVDSGLLCGARREGRKFIERQGEVLEFAKSVEADWCAMLDIPQGDMILKPCNLSPDQALDLHLKNAERFSKENMGKMRRVMAIQGRTFEAYKECAELMKPYIHDEDVIAVGGVAHQVATQGQLIVDLTKFAAETFPGHDIHLFGITKTDIVAEAFKAGATSCDSATASIHLSLSSITYPKLTEKGTFAMAHQSLKDTINFPLSIGRKLRQSVFAFNMGMVEAGILTAGGHIINADEVEMPEEWKDVNME